MRISDWSSDVCSSDLFLLNALVENIGQFIVTFPARTLQTFAYAPGSAEWMGGWRDGNGVRDAYLRVTGDHHRLFGDGILLQGAANGARSEEHTSELQSLMRISYAVFCLKKKIKITISVKTQLEAHTHYFV